MVSSAIFRSLLSLLSLWVIVDMVEGGVGTELDRTEISVFNVSSPTTLISQMEQYLRLEFPTKT